MYKHLNKKIYFLIFLFFFLLLIFYIYFKFYKIKNYPFFELTLIEEHFDIDGYSAFQGIDLLNLYDEKVRVFFATGYAKSFVIFDENSKLFGEPLESDVLDDPELLPAVFAKDLNIIFWTSWRNGKIYLSNSDINDFEYEEWLSGFNQPIGIDGNESNIFVANHGNHEIHKYDYNKNLIWNKKFKINNIELSSPYSIRIFNENLLISFQKPFAILKTDLDGKIINYTFGKFNDGFELDGSSFNNLQTIDYDDGGQIYAIDTYNKRIIVLNSKLEMLSYLTFNEANNWRGLKIDKKNKKMYVTGFKKGLEGTESKTGFWIFDLNNLFISNQ